MRYAARQGVTINTQKYFGRMEKIFKMMAKAGKGLEINATSFYQPLASPLPTVEVLKLFKECGGEVITLGSDAHEMENLGRGLDVAKKLALDAGFTKKALFSQRNVSCTNL